MQPLKPMEPMTPMEPMRPLEGGGRWWPEVLGEPSATGAQGGVRYAFFPDHRRLLIERDGKTTAYDSGRHRISGVQADGGNLVFTGEDGPVRLDTLKQAS